MQYATALTGDAIATYINSRYGLGIEPGALDPNCTIDTTAGYKSIVFSAKSRWFKGTLSLLKA